ncbi:MAG: DUF1653 domain-containing protein, partial [Coleofasciculaceae cyanobacterium]
MKISCGTYRHFKGGLYEVVGVVRHSETEELLVLYKNSQGDLWVRPYQMFFETVIHQGREVERFRKVDGGAAEIA